MSHEFKTTVLGRTGLRAGRLGLAGSYGAPAGTYEWAFERGCNYFYSGSGRKRSEMIKAVRNLTEKGVRDRMIISVQTYARWGIMTEIFYRNALKRMGVEFADILMLGWHNSRPSAQLMDFAMKMKEKGLCRFIGMSGHNRKLFAQLVPDNRFDLFHIRYNAAHRGAETDCFPVFEQENPPGLVTYTATRWGHLLMDKHMPEGDTPLTAPDCYRFSLSDPRVNICLCGPKNMDQMKTAFTALEMGPLDEDEKKRLIRIGDHVHDHAGGFF